MQKSQIHVRVPWRSGTGGTGGFVARAHRGSQTTNPMPPLSWLRPRNEGIQKSRAKLTSHRNSWQWWICWLFIFAVTLDYQTKDTKITRWLGMRVRWCTDGELDLSRPVMLSSNPPADFDENRHFTSQNEGVVGLRLPCFFVFVTLVIKTSKYIKRSTRSRAVGDGQRRPRAIIILNFWNTLRYCPHNRFILNV